MNTLTRSLVTSACLLVGTLVFAVEEKPLPGSADESATLALAWLKLVDDGDYDKSWKEAGSRFKATVTEEYWVAAMRRVREPLGLVSARELIEAKFAHEAPRAPKGDYWIVRFRSAFEGTQAEEIVILAQDADEHWRAVGFFIRPPS